MRSIPAGVRGNPGDRVQISVPEGVYPRACGGTLKGLFLDHAL